MGVSETAESLRGLEWLRPRLAFYCSFLVLGIVVAACTWLAFVTLPGLSALLAVGAGAGEGGARVIHRAVLCLSVVSFVVGGILADRVLGDTAIGVGAVVVGVGAVAFAVTPGVLTTAVVALSSIAGLGVVMPALVSRAYDRSGPDRIGTAFAVASVGYLLANAVVLFRWYLAVDWFGLLATSYLLADGVVAVPPRALVYETFGSWQRALIAIGTSLIVVAFGLFVVVSLRQTASKRREVPALSLDAAWTQFRRRASLPVWILTACVAWTVAAGLSSTTASSARSRPRSWHWQVG